MTIMRRECVWCPITHTIGAVCTCGSKVVYKYGQSDRWHCLNCGMFFQIPDDAPVTHSMCQPAADLWKQGRLPKRDPWWGFIKAAPWLIAFWCAVSFGLGWLMGNDFARVFGGAGLCAFALVVVSWLFRTGLKLFERKEGK